MDRCFSIFNNAEQNHNILINDKLVVEEPVLMLQSKNIEMKKILDKLRTDEHKKDDI